MADSAPLPQTANSAGTTLRLERKHPLAIRWMHWINFPILSIMIWSGLLIYWNDSGPFGLYPHQVYRVGLGHFTLFRFFPAWLYAALRIPFKVTQGLGFHFFFMWLFAINGGAYLGFLLLSREWRFILPHPPSVREAIQVTLVDMCLRHTRPTQTKYNAAQRIAYTAVIAMGAGALVTGLAIYKPNQLQPLTALLGGYQSARYLHFLLTMAFCGFFLVHVLQVVHAGWGNFQSIITGYELRSTSLPSVEAERAQS